jgi:16S rRNA (guanine(966)-N(2))-methyltransferase RsmD
VLDLFAGTGALSIEALSRGASEAVLVDRSPQALATVRDNLVRTRLGERARVMRSEVGRFLERAKDREQEFDLVFVDPPYELGGSRLEVVLDLLDSNALLSDGAAVVLTRASRDHTVVVPVHWVVARRLAYGDSVVTLFQSGNLEV